MATIKDVAQAAGVSATTVSIILNGKADERKISAETRERVHQAIQDLHYQPSFSARALRGTDANVYTVGLYWVLDYRSAFLGRFLTGLQSSMLQSSIRINFVICPYKPGELHKEKALWQTTSYNAVIIANLSEQDSEYIHNHPIPMPVILNNRISDMYHCVYIDSAETGRCTAKYLLDCGVRKPAIVSMNSTNYAMNNATAGFMEVCIQHDIQIPDSYHCSIPYSMENGSYAGEYFLSLPELPDGIFCDSDAAAYGLLHTFALQNISVPEKVKVIATGISNPNYCRFFNPSLTTVDVPLEELGSCCFEIVERLAKGICHETVRKKLSFELFERASTL